MSDLKVLIWMEAVIEQKDEGDNVVALFFPLTGPRCESPRTLT